MCRGKCPRPNKTAMSRWLVVVVVDLNIGLKGSNLICFLVCYVYFFGGDPKSIAKLDEGPWPDFPPLHPPMGVGVGGEPGSGGT